MKRTAPDNKTLDAIGATLVRLSIPRTDEIEKLIDNPRLFEMVLNKIESDGRRRSTTKGTIRTVVQLFYSNPLKLSLGAAIIVGSIFSAPLFRTSNPLVAAHELRFPDAVPAIARPVSPPKFSYELSPGRASFSDIAGSEARHVVKTIYRPPRPSASIESDGEFYELSAGSDPNGTLGDGRIVRVDIKRSSLLALGVNLPLENESETVRADLLVGPDGVTRGFRLVK